MLLLLLHLPVPEEIFDFFTQLTATLSYFLSEIWSHSFHRKFCNPAVFTASPRTWHQKYFHQNPLISPYCLSNLPQTWNNPWNIQTKEPAILLQLMPLHLACYLSLNNKSMWLHNSGLQWSHCTASACAHRVTRHGAYMGNQQANVSSESDMYWDIL